MDLCGFKEIKCDISRNLLRCRLTILTQKWKQNGHKNTVVTVALAHISKSATSIYVIPPSFLAVPQPHRLEDLCVSSSWYLIPDTWKMLSKYLHYWLLPTFISYLKCHFLEEIYLIPLIQGAFSHAHIYGKHLFSITCLLFLQRSQHKPGR